MLEDELLDLIAMRWRHRRNDEVVALIDRALVLMTQLLEAREAGPITEIEAEVQRLHADLQRAIKATQTLH
jgi:hypothetical protein